MLNDYLKTFPQYLLPKKKLTALAGLLADVTHPKVKNYLIRNFIHRYQVDMSEAKEENPEHYKNFNDFFTRHLKPECRPLANSDIISPVDGYVSEIGSIYKGKLLQAKQKFYSVEDLLGCSKSDAEKFNQGIFATLYLSPRDYHRVHMPFSGKLVEMTYIPGKLFSVQPTTARVIPKLFAINERIAAYFETEAGLMTIVMVGATIVGGMGTSWHGHILRGSQKGHFKYPENHAMNIMPKGSEMGYFKLGSTVIVLFSEGTKVSWRPDLHSGSRILFGEALGAIT